MRLINTEIEPLRRAGGGDAPELPAAAVGVGAEVERAVQLGEAAAVAAGISIAGAGADLQLLHGAAGWIGPVQLIAAGFGVGGEVELAAAPYETLRVGAVAVGVDVGQPLRAGGGAVALPELLIGAAIRGGEDELAAAGREVGDARAVPAWVDVAQQLRGGVVEGIEAPELGARAGIIRQEKEAAVERRQRARAAPVVATGCQVVRGDLAARRIQLDQLTAKPAAAGIGGIGAIEQLAIQDREARGIGASRSWHQACGRPRGGSIHLKQAPPAAGVVGADEEGGIDRHQLARIPGPLPRSRLNPLHHPRGRIGPP